MPRGWAEIVYFSSDEGARKIIVRGSTEGHKRSSLYRLIRSFMAWGCKNLPRGIWSETKIPFVIGICWTIYKISVCDWKLNNLLRLGYKVAGYKVACYKVTHFSSVCTGLKKKVTQNVNIKEAGYKAQINNTFQHTTRVNFCSVNL